MSCVTRRDIPCGYTDTMEATLDEGHLVVDETWQYTVGDDLWAVGSQCTLRTAYLNGQMVTDPAEAQRLYEKAGFRT